MWASGLSMAQSLGDIIHIDHLENSVILGVNKKGDPEAKTVFYSSLYFLFASGFGTE